MTRFLYILLISLILNNSDTLASDKDSMQKGENNVPLTSDTIFTELTINSENLNRVEKFFKKENKEWLEKYGPVFIAIVALLGTLLASLIGMYASARNVNKQLMANQKNLQEQLKGNYDLEKEKKKIEQKHLIMIELKENVAQFIKNATLLNQMLNYIIYKEYEEGRVEEARNDYLKNTQKLRNELTDRFYSIKVSLDGSDKQMELEKVLNKYMNITCFEFKFKTTQSSDYEHLLGELYHKIKAIIHDNYIEIK